VKSKSKKIEYLITCVKLGSIAEELEVEAGDCRGNVFFLFIFFDFAF